MLTISVSTTLTREKPYEDQGMRTIFVGYVLPICVPMEDRLILCKFRTSMGNALEDSTGESWVVHIRDRVTQS